MQQQQQDTNDIAVTWRGKKFIVEMNSVATLKELGDKLQNMTDVKADTMRLIVPSNKSSKLLSPFIDEHSLLTLQETSIFEGKTVRMMGVPKYEVDQVLQNAKADLRIAGFDEEEKRIRQRTLDGPHTSLKLPQGNYIFCDFRTLHIPGIELSPPASEALKLMHMLAADPGIVAIMNKHRWRVGIMTEMAPVGYVGVSPKCILGFNKNHGEEISLRLRTDDLKGFRKYESIKKTLLHELAHMIHSEHDANFYALDKQLNQEAATLDWTRSRSHTLSGVRHSQHYEEGLYVNTSSSSSQKLGGKTQDQLANARASSVAAAYRRLVNVSNNLLGASDVHEEPDPDDSGFNIHCEPDRMDAVGEEELNIANRNKAQWKLSNEPDPDDCNGSLNKFEPDPDDSKDGEAMEPEPCTESSESRINSEPDPDDSEMTPVLLPSIADRKLTGTRAYIEPDPDDLEVPLKAGVVVEPDCAMETLDSQIQPSNTLDEPDPDDFEACLNNTGYGDIARSDRDDSIVIEAVGNRSKWSSNHKEPDPDDSQTKRALQAEPDPDDSMVLHQGISRMQTDEPDPDDQELKRIQDPVSVICSRLQKAIEMLQSEVNPSEAVAVVQTLFKIIRNAIEHPGEMRFKKLRKANPIIQRNIASYKAAMEILFLIGFSEDVVLDEIGKAETYLVLKRNDPGLLWLAKSSLETCIAY